MERKHPPQTPADHIYLAILETDESIREYPDVEQIAQSAVYVFNERHPELMAAYLERVAGAVSLYPRKPWQALRWSKLTPRLYVATLLALVADSLALLGFHGNLRVDLKRNIVWIDMQAEGATEVTFSLLEDDVAAKELFEDRMSQDIGINGD